MTFLHQRVRTLWRSSAHFSRGAETWASTVNDTQRKPKTWYFLRRGQFEHMKTQSRTRDRWLEDWTSWSDTITDPGKFMRFCVLIATWTYFSTPFFSSYVLLIKLSQFQCSVKQRSSQDRFLAVLVSSGPLGHFYSALCWLWTRALWSRQVETQLTLLWQMIKEKQAFVLTTSSTGPCRTLRSFTTTISEMSVFLVFELRH